jgi:uncharacterized protein (TIGR03086 family)
MTIQALFIMSNEALLKSILQVTDDQYGLPMPEGMSPKPTTLGEAIRRHTYDDAWVPNVLAGKTKEEVGTAYEALLMNDDVQANYSKYNQQAIDAVRDFTDLAKVVHLSYGDFPAGQYLQHIIVFRAFRSYDIAKLIGVDTAMAPDFVQALSDEFSPAIDGYRQMGVFPPALPVADDADPQTKLLAMVGRA